MCCTHCNALESFFFSIIITNFIRCFTSFRNRDFRSVHVFKRCSLQKWLATSRPAWIKDIIVSTPLIVNFATRQRQWHWPRHNHLNTLIYHHHHHYHFSIRVWSIDFIHSHGAQRDGERSFIFFYLSFSDRFSFSLEPFE